MEKGNKLKENLIISHKYLRKVKEFIKDTGIDFINFSQKMKKRNKQLRDLPYLNDSIISMISSHQQIIDKYTILLNEIGENFKKIHVDLKNKGNDLKNKKVQLFKEYNDCEKDFKNKNFHKYFSSVNNYNNTIISTDKEMINKNINQDCESKYNNFQKEQFCFDKINSEIHLKINEIMLDCTNGLDLYQNEILCFQKNFTESTGEDFKVFGINKEHIKI